MLGKALKSTGGITGKKFPTAQVGHWFCAMGAPYDFQDEGGGANIGFAGSGSQHENRPPYFELAYIQRLN